MGRSRIRGARPIATLAAVTALGAILVGSAGAASRPRLKASKHIAGLAAVTYGGAMTLSGADALSGTHPYTLQAEPWPFTGGFHTVANGSTSGSYSFSLRPSHATRYRISVGGQNSYVLTVYVLERSVSQSCNLCNHGNVANPKNVPGTHTLIVKGSYVAPPGPRSTGPAYFYYGLARTKTAPTTLSVVKTFPRHFSGNTFSVTIKYTVNFPVAPFAFAYDYCWKENEAKTGVGLPGRHQCGDATINRLTSYAG